MIKRIGRSIPIKLGVFLLVSVYVLVTSFSLPETNAYLKDGHKREVLTQVGDLKIVLDDADGIANLPITQVTTRKVTVTNQSNTTAFIRVTIHPVLVDKDGITRALSVSDVVKDLNLTDWVDGKDGFYYYKKVLRTVPNQTTDPIFTKLQPPAGVKAADKVSLQLKVEAVTTAGNAYRNAWWEGETPNGTVRPDLQGIDTILNGLKE